MGKKYPAIFLLIFIVAGIILADFSRIGPVWIFSGLILFVIGGVLFLPKHKIVSVILFGLALLCFSAFRFALLNYSESENSLDHFVKFNKTYHIYGQVDDWPILKLNQTQLKIKVDSLEADNIYPVEGSLLLTITDTTTAFQRGDRLEFVGRIYPVTGKPFGKGFDYQRYLRLKGISGMVYTSTIYNIQLDRVENFGFYKLINRLRSSIRESLYKNLSANSASLAAGFLIGETRDIPPEIYEQFKRSGTLHLLAVSGSNVALIVLFFVIILTPLSISHKKRNFFLIGVVIIFSFLAYGEPSVMRAAVMATLVLLAKIVERKYDLNQIIAVTACIILLFDPSQLFDIGFQLSFVIAWGLIFTVPPVTKLFERHHLSYWYRFLLFPFLVSLIAQIYSIGLIGLYFQKIPIISPLANLIIVPLVSLVVVGIMILLLAHLIAPILGSFIGGLLNQLIETTIYMVDFFSSEAIPLINVSGWTFFGIGLLYMMIFMFSGGLNNKRIRRLGIIMLIIIVNGYLVEAVVAKMSINDKIEIILQTVPGGVAGIISKDNNSNHDLVITHLKKRDYDVGEKILRPMLEAEGIERLDNLIILSADYDAWRSLLLIGQTIPINKIYTPHSELNKINDLLLLFPAELKFPEIIYYYPVKPSDLTSGYNFVANGFLGRFSDKSILIVDQFDPALIKDGLVHPETVIIGQTWNINQSELDYMAEKGVEHILCSKIGLVDEEFGLLLKSDIGEGIVDLRKRGKVRFFVNIPN